jgi:hypothetical protein
MTSLPPRALVPLAVSAVPRIFRAARRAGLGRRAAVGVVADSAYVQVAAARHSPRRWREENAIRHFTWQAWLTARHGRRVAEAIAAAQEQGRLALPDSAVDLRNNAAGQDHGAAQDERLVGLGRRAAVAELLAEGTRRFRAGRLAAEPRRRRRRPAG